MGNGAEKFLEKWKLDRCEQNVSVRTADGSKIDVRGSVLLPIQYNNQKKYIQCLIVPQISKTLFLDINFWEAFSISPIISEISAEQAQQMTLKSDLDEQQKGKLARVLRKFEFIDKHQLGHTTVFKHRINVGDSKPVRQQPYVVSPYIQKEINEEIQRMLDLGIIERAACPKWLNPIIPVRKSNGKVRLCLDARELNKRTIKHAYPQQNANRILSRLSGSKYLSTIDLSDAYYQIEIDEPSRDYTAFAVSGLGTFRYVRMANGLCNAGSTLCEAVDSVAGCDLEPKLYQYMDDFVVSTEEFDDHLEVIDTLLSRLNGAGFSLSLEKSKFCRENIDFLGFVVSKDGLRTNNDKIEAIVKYPAPRTLKQAGRFIGMVVWHGRFVSDFSTLLAPITETLKNPNSPYKWTGDADEAFNEIKQAYVNAPVLALPDYSLPFSIHLNVGVGAMLTQVQNGEERVVAYYSSKLTSAQQKYFTTEKECLAVILALENFRKYIEGVRVTVFTDHASLLWLHKFKESNGRLVRWALRLQAYDFELKHKKGKNMQVPDALSRIYEADVVDSDSFVDSTDKTYHKLVEQLASGTIEKTAFKLEHDILYKRDISNLCA